MSFEQIDINNRDKIEGRSCIIIYNFQGKQLQSVKNYANLLGIKDQIFLSHKNEGSKISEILQNTIETKPEGEVRERAIIFNSISSAKINVFIENLKKIKVNNILFATVTETSKEWTIDKLIKNLVAERWAIKSGKFDEHH